MQTTKLDSGPDPLTEETLLLATYEWQVVTQFAWAKLDGILARESAVLEAAAYLRYNHALSIPEWIEVDRYLHHHPEIVEAEDIEVRIAQIPDSGYSLTEEGDGFDASALAQQFWLLFGFAAQYTRSAEKFAVEYIQASRGLSTAEWEAVEACLREGESTETENV